MAQLLTGRLVQGLGSGAMNVAIFVCVAQAYSLTQRPKMFPTSQLPGFYLRLSVRRLPHG
jgi:hypothetical protein